jgi:predicted MFS family arabinose efflux permease
MLKGCQWRGCFAGAGALAEPLLLLLLLLLPPSDSSSGTGPTDYSIP